MTQSFSSTALRKVHTSVLKSKLIDADLSKIAAPLEQSLIDAAEITATDGVETLEATIGSGDKSSFSLSTKTESTQEMIITGTLLSNSKETKRGLFVRGDGSRVPYRYIGESPELFQTTYAYSGAVRATCIAYFDENIVLKHIDIKDAVRLQRELELS